MVKDPVRKSRSQHPTTVPMAKWITKWVPYYCPYCAHVGLIIPGCNDCSVQFLPTRHFLVKPRTGTCS